MTHFDSFDDERDFDTFMDAGAELCFDEVERSRDHEWETVQAPSTGLSWVDDPDGVLEAMGVEQEELDAMDAAARQGCRETFFDGSTPEERARDHERDWADF